MKIMSFVSAALVGGVGYPVLEILYRGRTHGSMALAGALALPMMRICARMPCGRAVRALTAAAGVTVLEGVIGSICNRDHRIWDYRNQKYHWRGQVCLQYCLLWYALSWALVFAPRRKRKI